MALIDDTLAPIQQTLTASLSWLDTAYGKIERREKIRNEKPYKFPAVFIGGDPVVDWVDLMPDEGLGSYSYFEIDQDGGYEVINRSAQPKFKFKLVFWFDWRDIFPSDWESRSIEEVKAQILTVLIAAPYTMMVKDWKWSEDAATIYRGFTHLEIDRQMLMRPYGGVAFMGEMYGSLACPVDMLIPTVPIAQFGLRPANYSLSEQLFPDKKWFGENIYWKTFDLGTGNDDYKDLTGLLASSVSKMIDSEYRAIASDGTEVLTKVSPELNGSGGYKVATQSFQESIFVTLYYTKNA